MLWAMVFVCALEATSHNILLGPAIVLVIDDLTMEWLSSA